MSLIIEMKNAPAGVIFNVFDYGSQPLRHGELRSPIRSTAETVPTNSTTSPISTPRAAEQSEWYEAFYARAEKLAQRVAVSQSEIDNGLIQKYGSEEKVAEARRLFRRKRMWPGLADDTLKDSSIVEKM